MFNPSLSFPSNPPPVVTTTVSVPNGNNYQMGQPGGGCMGHGIHYGAPQASNTQPGTVQVQTQVQPQPEEKKGFFAKIGGFFGGVVGAVGSVIGGIGSAIGGVLGGIGKLFS
ncbi:hypothetical protein [Pseudomonas sp. S35]|uniref:hypothetical protein n=1 Tax=Pseudomonas sp. S35 TaxID=1573719 RepID=UPI001359350B|nr:hypothetical protein [Pseudomonas sp. S35]